MTMGKMPFNVRIQTAIFKRLKSTNIDNKAGILDGTRLISKKGVANTQF